MPILVVLTRSLSPEETGSQGPMRGLQQQVAIHLGQSGQIFQQLIGVCIPFTVFWLATYCFFIGNVLLLLFEFNTFWFAAGNVLLLC
jgi:hypothetical protein